MITPNFHATQSSTHVTVVVDVPSARFEDADIDFLERTLMFSCKPYYLRLHFSGHLKPFSTIQNIDSVLQCNEELSQFTINLPKQIPGEEFDLGHLPDLLKLQKSSTGGSGAVVELEGGCFDEESGEAAEDFIEQLMPPPLPAKSAEIETLSEEVTKYGYGFAFRKHGELGRFRDELKETFVQAFAIEESVIEERSEMCREIDILAFDEQYFLADFFDPPPELSSSTDFVLNDDHFVLTPREQQDLDGIRNRKLPKLGEMDLRHVLLGLVDVLFAYVYEMKVCEGETTCESSWTIVKLAPTFCALARYESAREALISAMRRSICYGRFRNWNFARKCGDDVLDILRRGPQSILACLIRIRRLLAIETQYRYLFNSLYVDDYIRLLRDHLSDEDFTWLPIEVAYTITTLAQREVDLDLDELIEHGKKLQAENQDEYEALNSQITGLNIAEPLDSDDDDDDAVPANSVN